MALALLSLGSNIDPATYLAASARVIREHFPQALFSPVHRYAAVGFEGPDFLNAGALIETDWTPEVLNEWLHALEDAHGRRRDVPRFSSRTLDIDLVFYDDLICEGAGNLQLPRKELRHAFVLEPLAELAPSFVDPVSGKTLEAMWQAHADFQRPAPIEPWAL